LTQPARQRVVPAPPPPDADKDVPLTKVERKARAPVSNDVLRVKLPVPVETVLDNGLTVSILEDHRLPNIVLQVAIAGAGSLFDPPALPGLASTTAQMLRQGTKSRSSKQLAEDVDNLGASIAASSGF